MGGTSKQLLDAQQTQLDVARTSYENLKENTQLISPIDGIVTARNYDNGDMYNAGNPVLTVQQITPVKLMIHVSEGFYTQVKEGMEVKIRLDVYKNEEFKYCFICFNYTDTLDQITNITRKLKSPITTHQGNGSTRNNTLGTVLHIHGTLNEEMILGVNDIEQVNSTFLKKDDEFLDTFIKRRMNNSIGQRKTEHAQKLIEGSHIICIFGMSIGNTDKMWWEEIVKWLNISENNKLVIFYKGYKKELDRKLPVNTIRLNNRLKQAVLEKGGADLEDSKINKLKQRIFISFNTNIFGFKEFLSDKSE